MLKLSKHTLKFKRMYGETYVQESSCWDTHSKLVHEEEGDKMVPNCAKNEDAEDRVKARIKARQTANDKRDRISLARAKTQRYSKRY